ncbi:MAG TPA: hypothetical protein GX717_07730, partial [Clostridiaceae bacterium]|nr:hypothetical protein [Clostridiaceae bacterium]
QACADRLCPALRALGVQRIDKAICTHLDADHAGGMKRLIEAGLVAEIVAPPFSLIENTLPDLASCINRYNIPHRTYWSGEVIWQDVFSDAERPFRLKCLNPSQYSDGGNDDSLVIHLSFQAFDLLVTGDISEGVERTLCPVIDGLDVNWDVLVVSHHGSKYSSCRPFLETVAPSCSVISVGRYNNYGHPAPQILERLAAVGSAVWRTDQDGCIHMTFSGSHITIVPWLHRLRPVRFRPSDNLIA